MKRAVPSKDAAPVTARRSFPPVAGSYTQSSTGVLRSDIAGRRVSLRTCPIPNKRPCRDQRDGTYKDRKNEAQYWIVWPSHWK